MSLFRKNSLSRSMLIGSLISFLVASLLPLWIVWYVNPWEGVGYEESFWSVLWELFRASLRTPEPNFPTAVKSDPFNLAIAFMALLVGALLGAIHYKFRRIFGKTPSEPPGNRNPELY